MSRQTINIADLPKTLTLATGTAHTIVLKGRELHVRLPIDPADVSSWDDKFVLMATRDGETTKQVKTICDDQVPFDALVDLVFHDMKPEWSYSLEVDLGSEGVKYFIFQDHSYHDLFSP